ncbi:MAG: TIM barrel protein [Eubacteriales bacterium]|nr:TIM barrel protein [Eubacteriales bacterium]
MIKFGPAGNCKTFYEDGYKRTIEAPKWLSEHGLDAYEYSFGKGFTLPDDTAVKIGEEMKKYGITVSIHAPYYINFATPTDEMAEKSSYYVIESLRKLRLMGGTQLVVHPASQGKMTREEAIELTKKRLEVLKQKIIENGYDDMYVCLETMGKSAQIGTYEEILDFCKIYDRFLPTFDFGHINALTQGTLKTYDDYKKIIDRSIEVIGLERTKLAHIHFSKIEYGSKGEIKHLTLEDNVYGPDFEPLAKLLKDYDLNCVVICESREYMGRDAMILKNIYQNI